MIDKSLGKWQPIQDQMNQINQMKNQLDKQMATGIPYNYGASTGTMGGLYDAVRPPLVLCAAPYMIRWYDSSRGRYDLIPCESDEEAIEKANLCMKNESCTQVQVFELAHNWVKSWEKK